MSSNYFVSLLDLRQEGVIGGPFAVYVTNRTTGKTASSRTGIATLERAQAAAAEYRLYFGIDQFEPQAEQEQGQGPAVTGHIEVGPGGTMITGKDGIRFVQLLALKGALRLESLGMKRRGPSALSIAKGITGLKTRDYAAQIARIQVLIDEANGKVVRTYAEGFEPQPEQEQEQQQDDLIPNRRAYQPNAGSTFIHHDCGLAYRIEGHDATLLCAPLLNDGRIEDEWGEVDFFSIEDSEKLTCARIREALMVLQGAGK